MQCTASPDMQMTHSLRIILYPGKIKHNYPGNIWGMRGEPLSTLSREIRKSIAEDYKRRKIACGIYAIRSKAADTRWVGNAANLSTVWNRITFELRSRNCRCRSLQNAWDLHGPEEFAFEVLEELDAEKLLFSLDRAMRERLEYWCVALVAERIG
jgi:hypothetical protein